jgi:hypothetical protein
MSECAVTGFVESAGQQTGADVSHHVDPQTNLATVKGCLSDDALGAVAGVGQQHVISLIGYVAEKVALQNSGSSLKFLSLQLFVAVEHGVELLLEATSFSTGMYQYMIFDDFALSLKGEYFGVCVILFK